MPFAATDFVPYAAALMPVDDTSPVGGAIDAQMRVLFADLAPLATDAIEIVSDNAADTTQSVTVTIFNSASQYVSEILPLQGLLPMAFNSLGIINRIESVRLSAVAAGNVTVRQVSDLAPFATIPPGELGFTRMFQRAKSDLLLNRTYYQKFFWKNTNGSVTLVDPEIVLLANPSAQLAQCLAVSVGDTEQTINRLTSPAANQLNPPGVFNTISQDAPANLAPGQAIGVWMQLTLGPDAVPLRSSFTTQILGGAPAT